MSASSRSKRNSKAPVIFEGGTITSKTVKASTELATTPREAAAPRKTGRADATSEAPEAVVNTTKAGTSTFFLLTLIQLEVCEWGAKQFPFQAVRSFFGSQLAVKLRTIEREDKFEPHTRFVTALNCVLVWTRARTATLAGTWDSPNKHETTQLVHLLSEWSRHLSWTGQIDEVVIVKRRQILLSGTVIDQGLIARCNCPWVRFESEPPIRDDELGRELDMYPRNAEQFAVGLLGAETAFSIWEAGSDVLLYAETWSEALLSPLEVQEFIVHCEKRVALWNSSMESLGLSYRFYGTMDWKRSEVPWHEAVNTKRLCGKEFLGVDRRERGVFD